MEKDVKVLQRLRRGKRLILTLSAFFISYGIGFLVDPFDQFWKGYFSRSIVSLLSEWVGSLIFWAIVVEVSLFIDRFFNKNIPWTGYPLRRLFIQTIIQVISIVAIVVIAELLFYQSVDITSEEEIRRNYVGLLRWIVTTISISLMISVFNTGNYLIGNLKKAIMETAEHKIRAAELKQAAVEAELQALKLQLDPHFVFNNLSVLSELILKDQQLGFEYSENFSKVYRYLLLKAEKDLVRLGDELKFLNAYIFLIQQRAGEGVQFDIDIDKEQYSYQLPTLTLQILIENALKHNKTLKSDPLKVRVYSVKKDELIIENTLIPLERKVLSSGIGINNIISRYALISGRIPQITKEDGIFKVVIPLLSA